VVEVCLNCFTGVQDWKKKKREMKKINEKKTNEIPKKKKKKIFKMPRT
jgi:hypothetical protein